MILLSCLPCIGNVDTKKNRQVIKMVVTQWHTLRAWEDQGWVPNFSPAAEEESTWMATFKWASVLITLLCVSIFNYVLLCLYTI